MQDDADKSATLRTSDRALIISVIRLGSVALLAYWSVLLLEPFLTIVVWSVIFAVALYPVYDWLAARLRFRVLAAAIVTTVCLLVIFGPATWLGLSLADNLRTLIEHFGDSSFAIPPPSEAVKQWPLIGEQAYELWYEAATNLKALVVSAAPELKPVATGLIGVAGSAGLNLLKFIVATALSGFLFIPGATLAESAQNIARMISTERGEEFVALAGATIRNVSRGVIGVSLLQTLLAGLALLVAGVPAAGLLSFLVLFFAIIQIGAWIVLVPVTIWSWFALSTTAAVLFTIYMLPVMLIDNVLRPLVMAKGLSTPMPVILVGVIGGTLTHGILGLFVGPIVLSISWQLLTAWMRDGMQEIGAPPPVARLE